MSRAGKFIPGGSNKGKRTGPIRAPEPEAPVGAPSGDGKKKLLTVGGLRKPISKSQKWPVYAMSAFVLALLVSVAWYIFGYLPMKHNAEAAAAAAAAAQQALHDKEVADEKAAAAAAALAAAQKGIITVDSNPSGAKVTVGDIIKTTPARIDGLTFGDYDITIQLEGYADYKTHVAVTSTNTVELPVVNLAQKAGDLNLVSPQENVTYTLTGPSGSSSKGSVPDTVKGLPIGDYTLTASQGDWTLAPMPVTITDHGTTDKNIKFPYAKVQILSTPGGATVRQGRTVLGTTPLTLPQVRPKEMHLTVDLPPYTIQTLDLHVTDFGNIKQNVPFAQGKDFIAAAGMPMVWITDGGYWASKYPFRQKDFEKVAGYNPSFFRGANLPVEQISWESATAFIQKLNEYEGRNGKLPQGYHYSLPTESQWDQFNADADISMAALSSNTPLTSTQNVGYSAPNKYGLYDTLGNVWEWCLDNFDDKGDHSLRGGTWLSLPDNFSSAATRQGGPPKDAEKFIGFRVVLVPNS